MIAGNQTWALALAQLQKQPLYVLVIPQYGIYISSFQRSALAAAGTAPANLGGYGVTLYGEGAYGT